MSVIDAVVIGGGPAGSAIARLLAAWGHSAGVLNKPVDRSRGLGESLPPSTKKLLDAIDVLDLVDRAGFYKTPGNTVWWASRARRVEMFDPSGEVFGYQVFRPDFDRVLLEHAASAGADVIEATARRVDLAPAGLQACATEADVGRATAVAQPFGAAVDDPQSAAVEYEQDGRRETTACRFVVDASGRAGVVAKSHRRHESNHRMYALVGVWNLGCRSAPAFAEGFGGSTVARSASGGGKALAERACDASHTVVEKYEGGWGGAGPISETTRHVGTMGGGTPPPRARGPALARRYP